MRKTTVPPAVILAGGESRRFWPLSYSSHKTLFELGEHSVIERTVLSLAKAGVTRIVVVESPRDPTSDVDAFRLPSDCLRTVYGDCRLEFIEQPAPAGQGDAIIISAGCLDDVFFVIQPESVNAGDIVTELFDAWNGDNMVVVAGQEREDFPLYAVMDHSEGQVTRIVEKPKVASPARPLCNMGIYLCTKDFVHLLAKTPPSAFSMIDAISSAAEFNRAGVIRSCNDFFPLKYPGHLWAIARYLNIAHAEPGPTINRPNERATVNSSCIVSEKDAC